MNIAELLMTLRVHQAVIHQDMYFLAMGMSEEGIDQASRLSCGRNINDVRKRIC